MQRYIYILLPIVALMSSVHGQDDFTDDEGEVMNPKVQGGDGSTSSNHKPTIKFHVDIYSHPKSKFSCENRKAGEYYADVEGANSVLTPLSFACPNGTIFNQATRVCSPEEQVFCGLATRFYDSVGGNIDSKGKDPKELPLGVFPFSSSNTWQIQNKRKQFNQHQVRPRVTEEAKQSSVTSPLLTHGHGQSNPSVPTIPEKRKPLSPISPFKSYIHHHNGPAINRRQFMEPEDMDGQDESVTKSKNNQY